MKKTRRHKRVTFPMLLLRGLLVAAALTAAFAFGLREYILYQIRNQSELQINDVKSELQRYINYIDADESLSDEMKYNMINTRLSMYTAYDICLDQLLFTGVSDHMVQVSQAYSPRGSAVSALVDEDDNVKATNKLFLRCVMNFGEGDPCNGFYSFKPEEVNDPAADKLKNEIDEFHSRRGSTGEVEFKISSIYYNKENRTFVPREGYMRLMRASEYNYLMYDGETTVEDEIKIHIELDDSRYEIMEKPNDDSTPRFGLVCLFGTPDDEYEKFSDDLHFDLKSHVRTIYTRDQAPPNEYGIISVYRSCEVYLSGKQHELFFIFEIDTKDPQFTMYHRNWMIAFSLFTCAVTLLLCWRRNVINKARYEFEDYQRDLTNHLAHDIKTPLMAIGGYAENILTGGVTEEEQKRYLSSILDNVTFTDSIITRTLFLNGMDGINKPKKEKLRVEGVIEAAFRKYALLLEEKNISYTSEGNAEIMAGSESFETAVENLISNAVKYTPEGGSIKTVISKNKLAVTNTVKEKLDTKSLLRPFVRGDEARSNTKGSGLGLSIAERAAAANGFKLKISCTDTEFRAEIAY